MVNSNPRRSHSAVGVDPVVHPARQRQAVPADLSAFRSHRNEWICFAYQVWHFPSRPVHASCSAVVTYPALAPRGARARILLLK